MSIYTVIFTHAKTRKVLKRFDYPASKILNKFFWEKLKAEELSKLLKSKELMPFEVKMTDYIGESGQNDRAN